MQHLHLLFQHFLPSGKPIWWFIENHPIYFLIPHGSSLIPQCLSIFFSMFRLLTFHLSRQRIAVPVAFYLAVTHQRPSQAYRFFPHPGLKLWKLLWPEQTAGGRPCYWKGFGRICISGLRGGGGKFIQTLCYPSSFNRFFAECTAISTTRRTHRIL